MKKSRQKTTIFLTIILCFIGSFLPSFAGAPPSTKNLSSLNVHKTAEWEGEWISVSAQMDAIEKRGLFKKAAAISKVYTANEIREYFSANVHTDIQRVKIEKGIFTFLSAEGTTVIGKARYTYEGFLEKMLGGREVQWHQFKLAEGYSKYPILICSEPYGVFGQWTLLSQFGSFASIKSGNIDAYWQSMMFPADLPAEQIVDLIDTAEFIESALSLLPPRK